jgi:hypothetical protein
MEAWWEKVKVVDVSKAEACDRVNSSSAARSAITPTLFKKRHEVLTIASQGLCEILFVQKSAVGAW